VRFSGGCSLVVCGGGGRWVASPLFWGVLCWGGLALVVQRGPGGGLGGGRAEMGLVFRFLVTPLWGVFVGGFFFWGGGYEEADEHISITSLYVVNFESSSEKTKVDNKNKYTQKKSKLFCDF